MMTIFLWIISLILGMIFEDYVLIYTLWSVIMWIKLMMDEVKPEDMEARFLRLLKVWSIDWLIILCQSGISLGGSTSYCVILY